MGLAGRVFHKQDQDVLDSFDGEEGCPSSKVTSSVETPEKQFNGFYFQKFISRIFLYNFSIYLA